MKLKKFLTLALAFTLVLSLAACGSKGETEDNNTDQTMTAEELDAKIQDLAAQENAIIEENTDLWQKLFDAMDGMRDELPQETNYGSYLLAGIELVKDQFTDDEVETLTDGAEKIRDLENEIQPLQEQYAALQPADDSNADADAQAFPAFTGKDLDGNDVDSSLFANNAVTVVNFWFSGCAPCVTELSELNALNEKLKEQGGAVIGINTDTLDGDADQISEAKGILEKKEATYQNIYFDSDSEAGKFASGIIAFPTTYVVDRNGNIVGEALLGGIDNEDNMAALQTIIDQVLTADSAN